MISRANNEAYMNIRLVREQHAVDLNVKMEETHLKRIKLAIVKI